MYRIIILFLTFFISTYLEAQDSMDYYPRMLQKEMETTVGSEFTIEELTIPPAHINQIYLGKYFSVHTNSQSTGIAYLFVGRVTTCRAGGCSINDNQLSAKESEFFDYYILYDSTCTIQKVKIFNYQATHGQEVTAKSWLRQFKGYRGESNLIVGKNVDAISGATISVEATAIDIEHKTSLLKLLLKKENS